MTPKVAIIILNWNGWLDTIECLESIYQIDYPNYCVIVVDNGSEDNSVEKIKEYCEGKIEVTSKYFKYNSSNKPIKVIEYTRQEIETINNIDSKKFFTNKYLILIKNEKNYGFPEGNNIGIKFALKALNPDYILLLNNDTVVDKHFLKELVKIAEKDRSVGIVAPKQFSYWNPNEPILRAHTLSFIKLIAETLFASKEKRREQERDYDREVDWAQASCLLVRKEVIKKIDLLDSKYFLTWEDLDWCISARKAGYKIIHSSKSKFWHKVSRSTRKSPVTCYFEARNAFLFCRKHKDYSPLIFVITVVILFSKFVNVIRAYDRRSFISFCRGIIDGIKILLGG